MRAIKVPQDKKVRHSKSFVVHRLRLVSPRFYKTVRWVPCMSWEGKSYDYLKGGYGWIDLETGEIVELLFPTPKKKGLV